MLLVVQHDGGVLARDVAVRDGLAPAVDRQVGADAALQGDVPEFVQARKLARGDALLPLAVINYVRLLVQPRHFGEPGDGDAFDFQFEVERSIRVKRISPWHMFFSSSLIEERVGSRSGKGARGPSWSQCRHPAPQSDFVSYSSAAPPARVCLMRKMTNSAGFDGATPISVTSIPASTLSGGLVSSSHLTKKAFSGLSPTSIPALHASVRNAPTSRMMRFQRLLSFGSKTRPCVPFRMDSSR